MGSVSGLEGDGTEAEQGYWILALRQLGLGVPLSSRPAAAGSPNSRRSVNILAVGFGLPAARCDRTAEATVNLPDGGAAPITRRWMDHCPWPARTTG